MSRYLLQGIAILLPALALFGQALGERPTHASDIGEMVVTASSQAVLEKFKENLKLTLEKHNVDPNSVILKPGGPTTESTYIIFYPLTGIFEAFGEAAFLRVRDTAQESVQLKIKPRESGPTCQGNAACSWTWLCPPGTATCKKTGSCNTCN